MSTPMSEYNELLNFKVKPRTVILPKKAVLESKKSQKNENPFAASFAIQMIIVLVILIVMLLVNTFFLGEYQSIEKYLKTELAAEVDWKNLFDMAKTFLRI